MSIISTQKFNANLKRLNDDALRELVSECFAYALWHYHKDGQKTPFLNMQKTVEGSKSFLADVVKGLSLGKRNKDASEEMCIMQADAVVSVVFADKKTQKELRAANRKAKAASKVSQATPAPTIEEKSIVGDSDATGDVIEGEATVVELESALIIGGQIVQVSAHEADALYDTLMAMRNQMQLRLAA